MLADWTAQSGPLQEWLADLTTHGWRHEFTDETEGVVVVEHGRTIRRFAMVLVPQPQANRHSGGEATRPEPRLEG